MNESNASARILIIDDEEATRYVFRRILSRAGFEVEEAGTGREGLAKAMLCPDLIIADVKLPDMLGYDVCRRIKSNPLTRSIPVLQVSASFVSDESRVHALEGGADSYLTQPIDPTVLVASVNALLRLRKAEALSHLSARQWQTTFDSLSDGLVLADADGLVTRANACFLQMLSLAPSDAERRPLSSVFESRFGFSFDDLRRQILDSGATEVTYANRWFRARYDTIQADHDLVSGSVLILTDITDHKKLQETLKLSERLAATGRLAHIIAHEINNPLEAMSNLLYLAGQDTSAMPETKAYIDQASSELLRISQITKQVLAYHRESKRPVLTAANEMLQGVLPMFRAQMAGMGVEFDTRFTSNADLFVNPGEIRQVFSNILANALDALSWNDGKLRIRCLPAYDVRQGLRGVRFLFSDNGSGIPAETVPHLFEAFYTTKGTKGSGIGLWISSELINKHKGRIRLRTRTAGPYRGTLFDIFLPADQPNI